MAANTDRAMLPLQSLLNPSSVSDSATSSPAPAEGAISSSYKDTELLAVTPTSPRIKSGDSNKKGDDSLIVAKSRPRGPINFPPFEDVDEGAMQQIAKFKITPFGNIHKEFHHIPYSSSKKDLFEKTGRESIEAFRYEFQVPGREGSFVVMWDYNIGIVRMNPFIKWGRFPKTKSSQLLDKNPGLRDISPGITGGAVLAQGYWIPYRCARALFATFCQPIAGALIPLFGPGFPSDCISPESSNYGNASISSLLIQEVTREAEESKRYYRDQVSASRSGFPHPRSDGPFCRGEGFSYSYLQPPPQAHEIVRPRYEASWMHRIPNSEPHLSSLPPPSQSYGWPQPRNHPPVVYSSTMGAFTGGGSHSLYSDHRRPEPYRTSGSLTRHYSHQYHSQYQYQTPPPPPQQQHQQHQDPHYRYNPPHQQEAIAHHSQGSTSVPAWEHKRKRLRHDHGDHGDHGSNERHHLASPREVHGGTVSGSHPISTEKVLPEWKGPAPVPGQESQEVTASGRKSSQYTAAMALVLLSGDQREASED